MYNETILGKRICVERKAKWNMILDWTTDTQTREVTLLMHALLALLTQSARQGGLTLFLSWILLEVLGQVTFRMSGILFQIWSVNLKLDQTTLK